jgi:hypothetical protein
MVGGAFGGLLFIEQMFSGPLPVSIKAFGILIVPFLLGGAAFGVAMTLMLWLIILPWRMWTFQRQNPMFFGEMELSADTDGLEVKGPRVTAKYHWRDFSRIRESKSQFRLILSRSAGLSIPKSDLPPEALSEIRSDWSDRIKTRR